jgi:tetratricopeptide (TPR) repeat protein
MSKNVCMIGRWADGLRCVVNAAVLALPLLLVLPFDAHGQSKVEVIDDNAASIAVVVGNKDYRQTVPVDYAHNDAEAMKAYLIETMGFRPENVFLLLDGTLSEMTQMFGSEARPESGRLWRSVTPEASNVFVYFSGHGVPDLVTGEPFLLPSDGDPNSVDSGYRLDTLYRNLELVKRRIGDTREVIVMIDACFTGETGRGETLLAVSAPGFTPALPQTGDGVIRLVATSGSSPANWDDEAELGLFTSRFLMGAGGLADEEGPIEWDTLSAYLVEAVSSQALRDSGRAQLPEIDAAPVALPAGTPVSFVAPAVAEARDQMAWDAAQNDRVALERYIAECEDCQHKEEAMAQLASLSQGKAAEADRALWETLSEAGQYQEYLDQCGAVCSYRTVALSYLSADDPSRDARVAKCDSLAAARGDLDRPEGVPGVAWTAIDGFTALEACAEAVQAFPDVRRLHYQQGRALDRLGRYDEAVKVYQTAADLGSMAALNNLATLHENGEGVPASPETAFPIYIQAAEGGDLMAMTNAARMLEYGRGTTKDVEAALQWYQRAADAGDGFAITKLVPYYISGGPGIEPDPEKAFEMLKKGIELREPLAMATTAVLIDGGFGEFFPDLTSEQLVLDLLSLGEAGMETLVATTADAKGLNPDTVRGLQQTLTEKQFYTGNIDGTFNPMFIRALDAYASSASSQTND